MTCYAIRNVFLFEARPDGLNVFEERVVCFKARTVAKAHAKAKKEAKKYAAFHKMRLHPTQIGYELDDEDAPKRDGAEVWSELYDYRGTLEEFYRARYDAFVYDPERRVMK